jgi:hypothetical protein
VQEPVAASAVPRSTTDAKRQTANDGNVLLDGVPPVSARIVEALRPYMHVRGALLQGWTEDGRGLYVLTRFGDTMQLHRVDAPGGARRQLTFLDEPVSQAHRRPGSRELVLAVDRGGSEFYQLYRFDAGRPAMRLLTDGASRNLLTRWDADGRRFAFTSTRRKAAQRRGRIVRRVPASCARSRRWPHAWSSRRPTVRRGRASTSTPTASCSSSPST